MKLPFKKKKKKAQNLVKLYDPESPGIIEIQRLFKTLYGKKGTGGNDLRSLMITSAMPQEGKSILVGSLALVAAHANLRTLVIDADLRRPAQHHQFFIPFSPGLSDYFLNDATFDQVIHKTEVETLKIIPCGNHVSSPGGLLHAKTLEIKTLIDLCHTHFDVVFFDVPPVVPVSDAELIGSFVDGVALIVKAGKTYRVIIERALALLQKANCNLIGLILNNITQALPSHYEPGGYDYRPGPVWSE